MEKRIKMGKVLNCIKDLSPEEIKVGYDFSRTMNDHDNQKAIENLTKIEQLSTLWRNETVGF